VAWFLLAKDSFKGISDYFKIAIPSMLIVCVLNGGLSRFRLFSPVLLQLKLQALKFIFVLLGL